MAEYRVKFAASAARELRSLPHEAKLRIGKAVDALCRNPRPRGTRKLMGQKQLFRIRAGDYRIIYDIDDSRKSILITRVRHRGEAYQ